MSVKQTLLSTLPIGNRNKSKQNKNYPESGYKDKKFVIPMPEQLENTLIQPSAPKENQQNSKVLQKTTTVAKKTTSAKNTKNTKDAKDAKTIEQEQKQKHKKEKQNQNRLDIPYNSLYDPRYASNPACEDCECCARRYAEQSCEDHASCRYQHVSEECQSDLLNDFDAFDDFDDSDDSDKIPNDFFENENDSPFDVDGKKSNQPHQIIESVHQNQMISWPTFDSFIYGYE